MCVKPIPAELERIKGQFHYVREIKATEIGYTLVSNRYDEDLKQVLENAHFRMRAITPNQSNSYQLEIEVTRTPKL